MTIAAGTKLGRYEIRSKIGEGGMGEVYLAQDTKLDRKVALKILPVEVAAHPDRMKRFLQEAKTVSALNHPNIITIYEIEHIDSVNFIATIIQLRAKGMTWMRLPFFVWAQFVTAFLLLLAFPPLEAAAVLQLMDNVAGTSFFLPTGLAAPGTTTPLPIIGGGSPLLWQHLFWFLGHPEVYVLNLPAMGIVCEIIAVSPPRTLFV